MELNNYYLGDCVEAMKKFPDKYFDLAIVDPPYGINMDGGKIGGSMLAQTTAYTKKDWDKEPPPQEYFDELLRVSKNQIIFGANHFISRIPFDSSCWVVWDKQNGENHFADCELAWTSFKTAVRKYSFRWAGMLQGNMKDKELRIHPTQKPVALYCWLLNTFAKEGDRILDTHCGSASSLIACHKLGFDYIGFDIDEEYWQNGNKRLANEKAQISLFDKA